MEIRKQMVPVLKRLIDNLDKNEIGFFDWFLKKNKISLIKNTVNSQRLIQENNRIKEIFGVKFDDSLTNNQRKELDNKLTIIQGMKDEFNEKLSEMTSDMIAGNKNKLVDLQTNIMAMKNMIVHGAGFKHLGLFTSDITNAISNDEMKRTNGFFNTAKIDDSKREKVLNTYKDAELVKEYKKLMMGELKVDYKILELVPKWYNMINGGAKTEEAIVSIRSEIGEIMDDIKKDYNLKIKQESVKPKSEKTKPETPKPKEETDSKTPEPKESEKKDDPENTSSSSSPFDDGWK